MVAKRIIPCLDVKNGQVVKGVNFEGLKEMGDAVELGIKYSNEGADELVYLDISAAREGRKTFISLIEKIALGINIPFTVGGGISSIEDAARLLGAGADKIAINTAALARPKLIEEIASKYGSQFVVCAIDAKLVDGKWKSATHGGSKITEIDAIGWAYEAQERGAGEVLFTSIDLDGTKQGYPCDVYSLLSERLTIPIIASGGAGSIDDFYEVFTRGKADAALAASVFHYGKITIPELKQELISRNILIRR